MAAKKEECTCEMGHHKKKMGVCAFILGLLVLVNSYWPVISWKLFAGYLLVIAGIVKMLTPSCACCK